MDKVFSTFQGFFEIKDNFMRMSFDTYKMESLM